MTKNVNYSPGILSMLPLFYVGWSDSVLSPSEIKLIHDKISGFSFLTDQDKAYLISYTDPQNPPSKEVFQSWVSSIKKQAATLDQSKKHSLAEIGMEMAKTATSYKNEDLFKSTNAIHALKDIEESLGVEGDSSLNLLLHRLEQSENKDPKSFSFDPKKLQETLDGDQVELKNRVRNLIRDPYFKFEHIADKDIYRQKTLDQVLEIAKQGFGALPFPTEHGGYGNVRAAATVFEILGFNDNSLTIKYGVQFGLFGGALNGLGTSKHHEKYMRDMTTGALMGCFAMTETGHGSNVKGLQTTAIYNHGDKTIIINTPTLNDGKEYIGNALHSQMAAVFAQLIVNGEHKGVHCLLVPIRENDELLPGVKIEDNGYKLGLNGVDNGRLWFDNVKVPAENLLDKFGSIDDNGAYNSPIKNPNKRFFKMLGALVLGRVCVGLTGISCSKTALTIAVKYALKRRQFNGADANEEVLIMDYPTHQKRLIPLIAKSYAYHFALNKLADRYADPENTDHRKLETDAAGLKALATWHATQTIQECREACGGKGYLVENRLANLKADSDIFTTFEGDNTVLLQLVAKGAMTEFKESFHNDGAKAVMRYISQRISHTMAEINPVTARYTSVEHLTDRKFHRDAFRYRYRKLLLTVSGRMNDYLKKRITPFDAFLKCQNHMIELAKAYTERYTLYEFRNTIKNTEDPETKKILNKLCDLYALNSIYDNRGWFLENDYMEGQKSKAIRRMITKICQDLRPDVEGLVDAFGIPEEVIAAPIALDSQ